MLNVWYKIIHGIGTIIYRKGINYNVEKSTDMIKINKNMISSELNYFYLKYFINWKYILLYLVCVECMMITFG